VDRYRRLARGCPTSTLADDALYRAAELLAPSDPAAARFELDRLLRVHAGGDQAAKARALAATLKAESRPRPAKKGAPAALADAAPEAAPSSHEAGAQVTPAPEPLPAPRDAAAPAAGGSRVALAPQAAPGPPTELPPAPPAVVAANVAAPADPAPEPALVDPPSSVPSVPDADAAASPPAELDGSRLGRLAAVERTGSDELPLSLVAGLKVRRVVIDAGHGGRDVGAIGKAGTHESQITLAIARKLRRRLEALGLEVLLTRDGDQTVSLESRTAFANERRADLFLSIHCNAAKNRKLRGIETYTLNLNSDRYAMRLAARENAGSERTIGDLQLILADLATKANTDDSVRLAGAIHGETVARLSRRWDGVKDLGTKQALFFVLLGAKMPAVLIETSFVSHPEEEQRLASDAYQDEVAAGIAVGVERFISERDAIARGPGTPE
jgi:N-acetylmuramoyl-L-alanine amidase